MRPETDLQNLPARQQPWVLLLREYARRGAGDLLLAALRAFNGIAALERDLVALADLFAALAAGRRCELPWQAPTVARLHPAERVLMDLLQARRGGHDELAGRLAAWLVRAGFVPAALLHAGLLAGRHRRVPPAAPLDVPAPTPFACTRP